MGRRQIGFSLPRRPAPQVDLPTDSIPLHLHHITPRRGPGPPGVPQHHISASVMRSKPRTSLLKRYQRLWTPNVKANCYTGTLWTCHPLHSRPSRHPNILRPPTSALTPVSVQGHGYREYTSSLRARCHLHTHPASLHQNPFNKTDLRLKRSARAHCSSCS